MNFQAIGLESCHEALENLSRDYQRYDNLKCCVLSVALIFGRVINLLAINLADHFTLVGNINGSRF